MLQENLDLLIIVVVTILDIILASFSYQIRAVSIILALPLVFVMPGYVLTAALFSTRSIDTVQRLLLSLALSLAIAIFTGLLLNLLPGGLQSRSWGLSLGVLTVAGSLLAAYRRRKGRVQGESQGRFPQLRISPLALLLFGLAASVIVFSIVYSMNDAAQKPHPGFTQLWILPAAPSSKSCVVRFGVRSFESGPVTYHVILAINGTEIDSWSPILLASQAEWNQSLPIAVPSGSQQAAVTVSLYRLDRPQTVYRRVDLTLYSVGSSVAGSTQQCTTVPLTPFSPQTSPTP